MLESDDDIRYEAAVFYGCWAVVAGAACWLIVIVWLVAR